MSCTTRLASSLTPELWTKIFVHMEELAENPYPFPHFTFDQKQPQGEMHQLKLVCKQFRDIFASHPGLVQRLYIGEDFLATSLPSLLDWMQQSKGSVQTFQSTCERPLVDIVLTALLSSTSSMNIADVREVSSCSILMIARFTRLEKIKLDTCVCHLDLAPLGVLQR